MDSRALMVSLSSFKSLRWTFYQDIWVLFEFGHLNEKFFLASVWIFYSLSLICTASSWPRLIIKTFFELDFSLDYFLEHSFASVWSSPSVGFCRFVLKKSLRFANVFVFFCCWQKYRRRPLWTKKWRQCFQNLKVAFLCQKVLPQTSPDQNTIFSESEWKNASFDVYLNIYNDLQICFWNQKIPVVKWHFLWICGKHFLNFLKKCYKFW